MTTSTYKRTIYWVNTTFACGAVAVDQDGKVYLYDTAPIYQWAAKKNLSFQQFRQYLLKKKQLLNVKKIDVEIDPF